MVNYADFAKAFHNSYTFQYANYDGTREDVTLSVQTIGELALTSGRVLVCDPGLTEDEESLIEHLKPGRYPVILSAASLQAFGLTVAYAMLRVSSRLAVRWEVALRPCDRLEQNWYGYSVDGGLASFMDYDAAIALNALENSVDGTYLSPKKFWNNLHEQIEITESITGGAGWANVRVPRTRANVIAFTSGHGDGCYACYWGYDIRDKIACLVTDFELFESIP
jgi:hypothetical protein